MSTRIITGIVLAVLVSLLLIFLPAHMIKVIVAGLVILAALEFNRIALPKDPSSSPHLILVLAPLTAAAIMFLPNDFRTLLLVMTFDVLGVFIFYLFKHHVLDLVLSQIAISLLGIFYIGFLPAFLGLIRDLAHGAAWVFILLAATFAADTGAYFFGKYLGRHKLAPHVSPSKTVEGLLGGIIASIAISYICKYIFFNTFSNTDVWVVGGLAGCLGPLGDLSESLLKRSSGVKDSGNLIPGHGGLLDRIDALLFVAPFVYCYAAFFHGRFL